MIWVRLNDFNFKFEIIFVDREEEEEEKLVVEEIEIIGCLYWYDFFLILGFDDLLVLEFLDIEE